jgi:hypothetical protein
VVTKTSKAANALHIQSLLTDIIVSSCTGQAFLSNIPVWFGHVALPSCRSATRLRTFLNSEFASYAFQAMSFCWAVYLFSNRHFSSMIQSQHLPFHISLVCDTCKAGCLLFAEFAPSATVFSSGNNFLQHVRASGVCYPWLSHQFILFPDQQDYHRVLETTTCNYYAAMPNLISLGHCCHRHARSRQ